MMMTSTKLSMLAWERGKVSFPCAPRSMHRLQCSVALNC